MLNDSKLIKIVLLTNIAYSLKNPLPDARNEKAKRRITPAVCEETVLCKQQTNLGLELFGRSIDRIVKIDFVCDAVCFQTVVIDPFHERVV